jgi:hypothetical protein
MRLMNLDWAMCIAHEKRHPRANYREQATPVEGLRGRGVHQELPSCSEDGDTRVNDDDRRDRIVRHRPRRMRIADDAQGPAPLTIESAEAEASGVTASLLMTGLAGSAPGRG